MSTGPTAAYCSLTIGADGSVIMCHSGRQYRSHLCTERRADQVIQLLDRLAKEHPEVCRRYDLQVLGETLFDVMFGQTAEQVLSPDRGQPEIKPLGETLGKVFLRHLDDFKKEGGKVRLRLNLVFTPGADRWSNLPWEFLYVYRPDQAGFFVAGVGTTLSLTRIVQPQLERGEPPNLPHMLVVVAQPRELAFSMTAGELGSLLADLKKYLNLADIPEAMNMATWDDITQRLADPFKPAPDIIHFIGHGRFLNGRSQIALHHSEEALDAARGRDPQRAPDQADWHNVEDLTTQFQDRAPWLFFMQTCNSGRSEADIGAFRGAAQQIALAGVPFVVAMQYNILAEDANRFAQAFYIALGESASVDEAVMKGREVLGKLSPSYGHPRFGTPVVYLRCDRRVLIRPRQDDPSSAPSASGWPAQQCPKCSLLLYVKGKRCTCRKWRLVYCENNHVNLEDDTECNHEGCDAPILAGRGARVVGSASGHSDATPTARTIVQ